VDDFDKLSDKELRDLAVQEGVLEGTGTLESGLRGAAQGLTLGFADEIAAGVESTFTDKDFDTSLEESRENFRQAEADNSTAFTVGDVAGSIAGAIALPSGATAKLAGNAALGAVNALGRSEDKSLGDAAAGAAFGAIGDKVGKVAGSAFGNATQKIKNKFVSTLTDLQEVQVLEAFGGRTRAAVGSLRSKLADKHKVKPEQQKEFLTDILNLKTTTIESNGNITEDFVFSGNKTLPESFESLKKYVFDGKSGVGAELGGFIEASNVDLPLSDVKAQILSSLNVDESSLDTLSKQAINTVKKEIINAPSLSSTSGVISLKNLQGFKTNLQNSINFEGIAGSKGVQAQRKKAVQKLASFIEDTIESNLGPESSQAFQQTKKNYRRGLVALDLIESEATRQAGVIGNLKESLSIQGSILGVSSFALFGNPLIAGGVALGVNKLTRSTSIPIGAAKLLNSQAANNLLKGAQAGVKEYDAIARRIVAASSRSLDSFSQTLQAGVAEVSLRETPLSRTTQEAKNRSHQLIPLVKSFDLAAGEALEQAFDLEDDQVIAGILSGLSNDPKARKLVQQGIGWDGKAVSEQDYNTVKEQIRTSTIPYAVRLKLLSDFDKTRQIPNVAELEQRVVRGNREDALKPRSNGRKKETY